MFHLLLLNLHSIFLSIFSCLPSLLPLPLPPLPPSLPSLSLPLCRTLWASTNNTVGFNHMIASAPDAEAYHRGTSSGPVAYALETMYQYTAYFPDNDPREVSRNLTLTWQKHFHLLYTHMYILNRPLKKLSHVKKSTGLQHSLAGQTLSERKIVW